MIRNPSKLQALIEEYSRLRRLEGFTPQSRGQRLNHFVAELLQCWSIKAKSNIRGSGEIDVGFEMNGRRFILEAKWENRPIGTEPIAKLQKRLRQRLGGTLGLFLSMSGFSPEAVEDLKVGEQLMVLLLSREHLQAMLSGFIPPQELINRLITKAAFYGEGLVSLQSLFETTPPNGLGVIFGSPDEIVREGLVVESIPGFQASVIASNLPFGQSGVAEFSKNKVLLTLKQGIWCLDYERQTLDIWFGMPGCSRNALVTENGAVFMVRKAGIGRLRNGEFCIVGGGFCGNVCLFRGRDEGVWVFSNGYPEGIEGSRPQVTQLGESIGDEKRFEIDYPPACGINAALISDGRFLVIGSGGVAVMEAGVPKKVLSRNVTNPMGLARLPGDRFIIASGEVELSELDISNESVTRVARLKLQGSVSELAESADGGGYLFLHYSKANRKSAGILIRWQY